MNQQQFDREKEVIAIDKATLPIYTALLIAVGGGLISLLSKSIEFSKFDFVLSILGLVAFAWVFIVFILNLRQLSKHKKQLSK